jgi:hypothetical protein
MPTANEHLKNAAFHACRALEFLENPNDNDDDVLANRYRHLFSMLSELTLASANVNVSVAKVEAEAACAYYFRGHVSCAIGLVKGIIKSAMLKPHLEG